MTRWVLCGALVLVPPIALRADVWDTGASNDNTAGTRNELVHGSTQEHDLGTLPGLVPDEDWYRIHQAPRSSYELVIDSTSADIGSGQGPDLERIASDQTTVVQGSVAAGAGASRSLRWESPGAGSVDDQYVRVRSAGCALTCDAQDLYRIRFYDTTYSMARLNNSATQVTALVLANPTADPIAGNVHYWSGTGGLIASQGFSVAPRGLLVLNTAGSAPGQSGSLTVSHNGCYGCLAGKAIAVEPSTGFTFDTPLLPRPTPGQGPLPRPASPACAGSADIQAARDAPNGPARLPICSALVTYVKPAVGSDPPGFFVQADPTGPALFIAVDPGTLTPTPAKGDQVSFTITFMGTSATLREAVAVSSYVRLSSGNPIAPLVQDLSSAADLVSALDGYESEVLRLTLSITQPFAPSGPGFVSAAIATAGMPAGDPLLRFRVPSVVQDVLDLAPGCTLTLDSTPMWRFNAQAQPSAWTVPEITLLGCPAPRVLSASAASSTIVVIDFDRHIAPASVSPGGGQFAFSSGLAATSAVVSGNGRQVTVTTTPQTSGLGYTVTVASSVTDTLGSGIDPLNNSAPFTGFTQPAVVVLNELRATVAGTSIARAADDSDSADGSLAAPTGGTGN